MLEADLLWGLVLSRLTWEEERLSECEEWPKERQHLGSCGLLEGGGAEGRRGDRLVNDRSVAGVPELLLRGWLRQGHVLEGLPQLPHQVGRDHGVLLCLLGRHEGGLDVFKALPDLPDRLGGSVAFSDSGRWNLALHLGFDFLKVVRLVPDGVVDDRVARTMGGRMLLQKLK